MAFNISGSFQICRSRTQDSMYSIKLQILREDRDIQLLAFARTLDCNNSCLIASGMPLNHKLFRQLQSSSSSDWSCKDDTWEACKVCTFYSREILSSREAKDVSPVICLSDSAVPPSGPAVNPCDGPPSDERPTPRYPIKSAKPAGEP